MQVYNDLLDSGWKMSEIDNMDMLGFFKVRAWKAQKEYAEKHPRAIPAGRVTIDVAWPGLAP